MLGLTTVSAVAMWSALTALGPRPPDATALEQGAVGLIAADAGAAEKRPRGGGPAGPATRPSGDRDGAQLAIAGRPVTPPPWCRYEMQGPRGKVVCAEVDYVNWSSGDETVARKVMAAFAEHVRKSVARPGVETTETEVRCRLAGVNTTCARAAIESEKGAVVVLWAMARTGRGFTIATCMGRGPKLGTACSLVFELP